MWCSLCDPTFSRFSRTPTCDRRTQTDGHRPMASTADAHHRAVKIAGPMICDSEWDCVCYFVLKALFSLCFCSWYGAVAEAWAILPAFVRTLVRHISCRVVKLQTRSWTTWRRRWFATSLKVSTPSVDWPSSHARNCRSCTAASNRFAT